MKTDKISNRFCIVLLIGIISLFINACQTGGRLYTGKLVSPQDSSLIFTNTFFHVTQVKENGKPSEEIFSWELANRSPIELLPGKYTLMLWYSDATKSSKGTMALDHTAEPGHAYFIYGDFSTPGFLKPAIVDISHDEEIAGVIKDKNKIDRIKRAIKEYYEGERPIIVLPEPKNSK